MIIYTRKKEIQFAQTSSEIEGELSESAWQDHLDAWDFLKETDTVSLHDLLECHYGLQIRLRPDIAGKFRTCNVRVGSHIMPHYASVVAMTRAWLRKWTGSKLPKTEEECRTAHIEFENIHPFEDGNGRVGRCILNWHRRKLNLPILIIHVGEEQQAYYGWFKEAQNSDALYKTLGSDCVRSYTKKFTKKR